MTEQLDRNGVSAVLAGMGLMADVERLYEDVHAAHPPALDAGNPHRGHRRGKAREGGL